MSSPLVASIDLSDFAHNVRFAASNCSGICAIVKANAYGHGAVQLVRYIEKQLSDQVQGVGVACMSEALELRHNEINLPILLLAGCFTTEEFTLARDYRLSLVVHSQWQLETLFNIWKPGNPPVWIKINTGMNRLGFPMEQAQKVIQELESRGHEVLLMSHYASADCDNSATLSQYRKFMQYAKTRSNTTSIGNSASVLYHSTMVGDIARPGIMLYGATPDNSDPIAAGLRPVMKLHSRLIAINEVAAGESVGYGATWTAQEDSRIGIVVCGYADAYPREVNEQAYASVEGLKCPLVGRISMDTLAVDLARCPQAHIGSEVELWGNDPCVTRVADWSNTIAYTLLTRISRRVRMNYIQ